MIDKNPPTPQESLESSIDLAKAANHINEVFRNGGSAYEVLDLVRQFPKPIIVDFNHVLANFKVPYLLNPSAFSFIRGLLQLGSVFIVTSSYGWEYIQNFLVESGLWSNEVVLMTSDNYEFITTRDEDNTDGIKLRSEFVEMAKRLGWSDDLKEYNLLSAPGHKRIAPIFGKPFKIPIIDDSLSATKNNPGMLGISVKMWDINEKEYELLNEGRPSLMDAVSIVRNHYGAIHPDQLSETEA